MSPACSSAAVQAGARTAAKLTAGQMRVFEILEQLAYASDRRGLVAQERTSRVVAAATRTSMPGKAAWVYCMLRAAASAARRAPQVWASRVWAPRTTAAGSARATRRTTRACGGPSCRPCTGPAPRCDSLRCTVCAACARHRGAGALCDAAPGGTERLLGGDAGEEGSWLVGSWVATRISH